jgi:AraC-like DNA-binding protein
MDKKVSEAEIQIHLDCFNYSKNKEKPLIELRQYKKGSIHQIVTKSNEIIVVLTGVLNFSFSQTFIREAIEGYMIILPIRHNCMIEIFEDTTFIIFRLDIDLGFCNHFSFEMLHRKKRENEKKMCVLNANDVIRNYLSHLTTCLNDGLYCGYLLEIKLKEFLYLLRYYYPMNELKAFFTPILSDDFEFSSLIRKHYLLTSTVNDLAKKVNYSISGFEKRFKKVFEVSPSQWMQSQKAQAIYHKINCSTKTFAELAYEFGFSSPSHFNNFCKKKFNETPGNIRRKQ